MKIKNNKQGRAILKDRARAIKARQGAQLKFFLCLMLLLISISTVDAITSPEESKISIEIFIGATTASMLAIGSIDDVPDKQVAGNAIAYKVWLIQTTQLDDSQYFPAPNANREITTPPLKAGEYMHYFEAHDLPTYTASGERGDLTIASTNTFTIIMGGVTDQLLNFVEEKAGLKFIVIFQECESSNMYILGNPCKPMIFKSFSLKNDKDNRSVTCVFESQTINQYKKYIGDLVTAPAAIHTADATTLAVGAANSTYEIPAGASAYTIADVSGLTANDKGRVVNLIGTAETNPASIAANETFVLEDGATWTAKAGSKISLRVLDPATLVEITGTRVQT